MLYRRLVLSVALICIAAGLPAQLARAVNFEPLTTLQGGVGFTYAFDGQQRFFAGIRWYHISNAQIFDSNPGRDSIYFYAGASLPF